MGGSSYRDASPSGHIALRLPYRPPLDLRALLAFFAPRAIPGVERIAGDTWSRTVRTPSGPAVIRVRPAAGEAALVLEVPAAGPPLPFKVDRIRHLFDLDADPRAVAAHLSRDPLLAPLVARHPGLRLPGAWDPFETAVRAILGQQVSVAAATTLAGRLAAPTPPCISGPALPAPPAPAGSPAERTRPRLCSPHTSGLQ